MKILNIIAIAKDKDKEMNIVFKTIIKMTKKDKPRTLLTHCLKIFPIITSGIRLKNIKNNGMIWLNNNAVIVYIIAKNNLARGSKLCKNESFFMNLKAFRNSNDMLFTSFEPTRVIYKKLH